ncbi:MAG: A24 family peptidase [Alphaproteobacteria bacterium]
MTHLFQHEAAHIASAARTPWVPALWLALLAWAAWQLTGTARVEAGVFALLLVLVVAVDVATFTIPNMLTLALAVLGVVVAGPAWDMALLGVAVGYGVFMAVSVVGRWAMGRTALGQGDVKLFGALGAWVGPLGLPLVALVGSWAALIYILALRHPKGAKLPFGPFLAAGGWVVYLYQGPLWDALAKVSAYAQPF